LSKRINNIDKIIGSKMTEGEINDKKGESNDKKIDEQEHMNNEVQTMFYVFFNWCFGEIDTIFIVMQVNIDGLTYSISNGNKKKMCKKTKMETISHEKGREIVDVSSQDRV
jgi:hypothetical protein